MTEDLSGLPERVDHSIVAGDSFERAMRISDDDGPVDITDWTITAQARTSTTATGTPACTFAIDKLDQNDPDTTGVFTYGLAGPQTQPFADVMLDYDVQAVPPDGYTSSGPRTLRRGRLIIEPDTTR